MRLGERAGMPFAIHPHRKHSAYDVVHRLGARSVQGFLARVSVHPPTDAAQMREMKALGATEIAKTLGIGRARATGSAKGRLTWYWRHRPAASEAWLVDPNNLASSH